MHTLEEVKDYIIKMSDRISINAESNLLPMFSETKDVFNEGASIYVDNKYHYIIMERGRMNKHCESEVLEDIIYPLFKDLTSSLAQQFELEHRKSEEDFRKLMWEKQLELLGRINEKFVDMRKREIEDILIIAPYSN
ncbi:Imm63 family immunity protein [Anaerorhabdus sp.]|uniref:Imm63 family immunity protein n=1 Tax=Anaerorhabdus sp. TaxID=1872524 RepID=UPI002FCBE936